MKKKVIRVTTVDISLEKLLYGQLRMLNERYEVVGVCNPGKEVHVVETREGIRVETLPMERHISIWKDMKSLLGMIRLLRRERPWMVHSITPKAGLISMVAARVCGVPVRVHMFTGLIWPTSTGLSRHIVKMTDRLTCACATHIVPEGEGVKRDLEKGGITHKPLRIIGNGNVNGIDLTFFDPSKFEHTAHQTFTFIFVGRMVRDKGINELMQAFKRLYDELPQVRLLLVGPFEPELDPVEADTETLIHNHPGVEFADIQPDVRPFFARADALVFPSYREGFPNVVLEAGAMGLPSIVTDINGCNEIIVEGENGIIIKPRDTEALYNAMYKFATNVPYVAELRNRARPMIASRYERTYVWKAIRERYQEWEADPKR